MPGNTLGSTVVCFLGIIEDFQSLIAGVLAFLSALIGFSVIIMQIRSAERNVQRQLDVVHANRKEDDRNRRIALLNGLAAEFSVLEKILGLILTSFDKWLSGKDEDSKIHAAIFEAMEDVEFILVEKKLDDLGFLDRCLVKKIFQVYYEMKYDQIYRRIKVIQNDDDEINKSQVEEIVREMRKSYNNIRSVQDSIRSHISEISKCG